ncbi:PEP-CTERM sorting domain-containing protein [Rubellicoccus peritrichatus]|uniref:PEP-CTERM sorting domain-containing protein n=1 Tax=Rubellicoccus peritrichatus TaxID=3080537 RepID=A0AAQ3LG65_9BACT|nr:PEP-CTERM sorting domain-containing protein [Puniceicoccus sp. CR14]WOO43270.1 PEP-CTERM sorting domain-containing protein [Puniceicoccus sp. CR14]
MSSAVLGLATLAGAQVLMLNFRNTGGPSSGNLTNSPYNTENPGFADTTWNNVSNSDVGSGLFWADGTAATGIGFDLGVANLDVSTVVDLSTAVGSANNLGTIVNTGIYAGDSIATGGIFNGSTTDRFELGLQVTGLTAGTYEVYVTGRNTNANNSATLPYTYYASGGVSGANFDFADYDSASVSFSGSTDATAAWVEAGNADANYGKFIVSISAGEALNIVSNGDGGQGTGGSPVGTANRGFLNSVQIVAVPEPGTWALMFGIAVFVCVVIRRKLA